MERSIRVTVRANDVAFLYFAFDKLKIRCRCAEHRNRKILVLQMIELHNPVWILFFAVLTGMSGFILLQKLSDLVSSITLSGRRFQFLSDT